ncbi:hypothetical protein KX729_11255 [Rhizobium sp. XQZ8]|uniref:hypothetical protein n=1 Tax=Rhizobium populisoli TaxID=2859785 RepID=UPI001CA5A19B|nr:hypothetical protein [Rhizobium populisoli]MBW6422021.1 hypothetical protein [Rhizobium populisoli]
MPKLEPLWALDPVFYLILQRYPILRFGARTESVGKNYDPDFEEKRETAEEESKAYRVELEQLPTVELKARIADARKREAEIIAASKKRLEDERFYNQPESTPDFKYWAKLSYWSLEEIVALSLGRDPKTVNWQSIGRFYSESEFVRRYEQHRTIVNRAKAMGQLWEQTIPNVAVAWARRMRIEIPDQLAAEIDALGIQVADWKSLFDQQQEAFSKLSASLAEEREKYLLAMNERSKFQEEYSAQANSTITGYQTLVESLKAKNKELSEALGRLQKDEADAGKRDIGVRERESLLKLVIGMAIGAYCFNPTMARNCATADIETDLATRGIPLDADTIRKYLNEGKALLHGEVTE